MILSVIEVVGGEHGAPASDAGRSQRWTIDRCRDAEG
jgi:hypothetical protein